MKVSKGLIWFAVSILTVIACLFFFRYQPQDVAYVNNVKHELVALANDTRTTQMRLAIIKRDDRWSDGRVGVTADGYLFFYDLHESHGTDIISDIHILYLPDEQRFLISHDHFCCDLSKFIQAKNKTEVVELFR